MRILAILAIVAATGFTVGCSKQPSTVETKTSESSKQETKLQPSEQDALVRDEVKSEVVAELPEGSEQQQPDITAQNKAIKSASRGLADKKMPKTSLVTNQNSTKTDTDVSSSGSLITKLLDQQTERAVNSKANAKADEAAMQKTATEIDNAKKLLVQSDAVAALPAASLEGYSFFGDPTQPGYQIQVEIFTLVAQGIPLFEATETVIERIVNKEDGMIGGEANRMVSLDVPVSTQLIGEISRVTNLTDATKVSIETVPDRVNDIITLGVVLYPDYAQDIINAAALTGEISDDDALLLAIAAGADPTSVSTATASGTTAGGSIAAIPAPLGSGIGAGGAGGGDTTASTN